MVETEIILINKSNEICSYSLLNINVSYKSCINDRLTVSVMMLLIYLRDGPLALCLMGLHWMTQLRVTVLYSMYIWNEGTSYLASM